MSLVLFIYNSDFCRFTTLDGYVLMHVILAFTDQTKQSCTMTKEREFTPHPLFFKEKFQIFIFDMQENINDICVSR